MIQFLVIITFLAQISAGSEIRVFDTPNDDGKSLTIVWQFPTADELSGYLIYRCESGKDYQCIKVLTPFEKQYIDEAIKDYILYQYQVVPFRIVNNETLKLAILESKPAKSYPQWFNTKRINVLVGIAIFFTLILYFIYHARRGKPLFIRRIAGLDAVEEAVGRATEMGRPILYVPGLSSVSDIATIAALNILGEVAKKTAQYETTLIVPNRDPIVFTVAREVVKEAYTSVGRPDVYKPENIFFITDSQFAYAAAVDGIMVREKPATNFFLGMFWAESLILAETGATTGAIQIAGTDSIYQLPFFITACDYTLIGEELYAASAYLSREPLLLGSLVGQDWGKVVIIAVILLVSILTLLSVKFPFLNILQFFSIG
jgi:hypothetical protein